MVPLLVCNGKLSLEDVLCSRKCVENLFLLMFLIIITPYTTMCWYWQ